MESVKSSSVESEKTYRILIAASGSGGHLLPAAFLAEALRRYAAEKLSAQTDIRFIGTGRKLEDEIIGRRGFQRYIYSAPQVKGKGVLGPLRFLFSLPRNSWYVFSLLREFKPAIVIGVGGYVSVLPVIIASLLGIPTWIHEAELQPGWANRLLSYFTRKVSVVSDQARFPARKRIVTGHPVNPEVELLAARKKEAGAPKRLLVLGGSLGAEAVDRALQEILPAVRELGLLVRHQCREENRERLRTAYHEAGIEAELTPFIQQIAEALDWADIIISRAGAGSVRDIGVANRPAIFIPLDPAKGHGRHQIENAETLVRPGKARLILEGPDLPYRLEQVLRELCDIKVYRQTVEIPYVSESLGAAWRIADGCFKLMKKE